MNLILAYNRKLTNQEVQDIYQSLSPRLSGNHTTITVSQTSIDEEVSIGTEVGTLTATDSDTTNLTYSLVSGNGTNDQHNSLFTVSGTQLIVAGNIDYETNATLNIYVQVSDGDLITRVIQRPSSRALRFLRDSFAMERGATLPQVPPSP